MADDIGNSTPQAENKTRRAALKTTAQVAVTAPAIALLLDATTKSASAQIISVSAATRIHALDDFTFGNANEDLGNGPQDDASLL